MNEYTIRPFQPGDLPALTALYNHYILHTTATFNDIPLTEQEMLAKVETAHRDNCPFLVLETADGSAAGYACADRFRPLDANRLAELSIYLAPEFTGRGRGSPLLEQLVGELKQRNFYAGLMAIITADNAPSLRFHRSHGFEDAGLWKNAAFKFGGWCDVLALELKLK